MIWCVFVKKNRHSEAMKCARTAVGELKVNFERYQQKHHMQSSMNASNNAKNSSNNHDDLKEAEEL